MVQRVTRLDYCQFLLSSQINYTLTYFADHHQGLSHDTINQYLREEKMTPRLLWDNVQNEIIYAPNGYVLFDDTVVDKNYSHWPGRGSSYLPPPPQTPAEQFAHKVPQFHLF